MATYTKRKDGRYQARIYLGTDTDGKKQFKYIYASSPKELSKAEAEVRAKFDKGIDITTINDTFSDWLRRLKAVKEAELTENEYNTFVARASYFLPYLGDIPLKEINQQNIQPAINAVAKLNPSTGKPSAKRTIQRYINAVSAVFEYAIQTRSADFNPCKYLVIPKGAEVSERRALTAEERKWIENTPHRAQTAAMLMMYSGLRRGEATALLWSDINLKEKTITVNKSYDFKTNSLKSPKTASGVRVVSIPDKLVAYLQSLEKRSIFVITSASGKMMSDTAWKRLWDSYLCDLDLKYGTSIEKRNKFDPKGHVSTIQSFTPHCLRHTFCTIMYEAGIDVLTAQEQMGHSDVKTTLAIYTHLDSQHKKKNVSKLNDYLAEFTG
jgi:integrase